jgi:hypothetical protein
MSQLALVTPEGVVVSQAPTKIHSLVEEREPESLDVIAARQHAKDSTKTNTTKELNVNQIQTLAA